MDVPGVMVYGHIPKSEFLLQNCSLGLQALALGGNQEHLISMTWCVMCSDTSHSSPGQL